jgi:hypothetical protein
MPIMFEHPPVKPTVEPVTYRVLGLDLGKAVDYTALIVLEWTWPPPPVALPTRPPPARPTYYVPALRRWPLGTSYVDIARWLVRFYQSPEVGRWGLPPVLVVDETGVGAPVVDMLREKLGGSKVPGGLAGVTITGGSQVSLVAEGRWRVAKIQLASVLVRLIQDRRLQLADLPETAVLLREAQTFSVKITPAGNETFESWREADHDDLVFALGLACWAAENFNWRPPRQVHLPRRLQLP